MYFAETYRDWCERRIFRRYINRYEESGLSGLDRQAFDVSIPSSRSGGRGYCACRCLHSSSAGLKRQLFLA